MSTKERIDELKNALLSVTSSVYHIRAHKATAPYIVWAEDGAGNPLHANGKTQEQPISGAVHLFERDGTEESLFSSVQTALNGLGCAWYLNSIQHERDTGLIHYEWIWEVC